MAQPSAPTATVDRVIDDWAGDLDPATRDAAADEVAYQYFSSLREELGEDLDAANAAAINKLARIPAEDKAAIYQRSNRVMRRIVRPLGYKLLQLQGLDPATASADAARAALDAPLTPEQQQEVGRKLEQLYESVYNPEVQAAVAELGLDSKDPEQAWQEFEQQVQQERQPGTKRRGGGGGASVSVPSALAGAAVALVVSRVFGMIKRRRQGCSRQASEEVYEEYEDEDGLASDSQQDDASAYAE